MKFKVKKILKKLSVFFIEQGKIFTQEEYTKLGLERQPIAGVTIKTDLGGYPKMLILLAQFAEANGYELPKQAQDKKPASAKVKREKISG